MNLVPVKLLKDASVRRNLLRVIGENSTIDNTDFLESRIKKEKRARELMAIEDASEIAKSYLHAPGIFEKIGEDIIRETGVNFTFTCSKPKKAKTPLEYVMMEWKANTGNFGHYGMARVDHAKKRALVFDSMTTEGSTFETNLKTKYGNGYKVKTSSKLGKPPQPTGGDIAYDVNNFRERYKKYLKPFSNNDIEEMFLVSQYDELSQHHFCYVESFISMMVDLGLAPRRSSDPRERLTYVKRVVWALIHKYVPMSNRNTLKWKYFVTNFPYILKTRKKNNEKLAMRGNEFQVVPKDGVKYNVTKTNLPRNINSTWSLEKIMKWA